MPEPVTSSEINSHTDPSVAKQYDDSATISEKFGDLYSITDKLKVCLLGTYRKGVGPVARSMAISKRNGPDFLFLANIHSKKFEDLKENKEVSITFQDSSSQNWVSISGTATTVDNRDPRIKELYTKTLSAWFGDLGDGVHNGKAEDPRVALIEVKSKYIVYWKSQSTTLGFVKEVATATVTGGVANVGVMRQAFEKDIEAERGR